MVIGQDWGDISYYQRHQGGDDPHNRTNEKLGELLRSIGFELPPASTQEGGRGVIFMTNAVLCLKNAGGLGAPVKTSWFRNCGARFLKPTIEIVSPQAVVTLGRYAYFTLRDLFNLPNLTYREAVNRKEGFILSGKTVYFPMYHCSQRVLNTHRSPVEQEIDWQKLTTVL
jgi:DNA polymerase